jgi:hypothetical protein
MESSILDSLLLLQTKAKGSTGNGTAAPPPLQPGGVPPTCDAAILCLVLVAFFPQELGQYAWTHIPPLKLLIAMAVVGKFTNQEAGEFPTASFHVDTSVALHESLLNRVHEVSRVMSLGARLRSCSDPDLLLMTIDSMVTPSELVLESSASDALMTPLPLPRDDASSACGNVQPHFSEMEEAQLMGRDCKMDWVFAILDMPDMDVQECLLRLPWNYICHVLLRGCVLTNNAGVTGKPSHQKIKGVSLPSISTIVQHVVVYIRNTIQSISTHCVTTAGDVDMNAGIGNQTSPNPESAHVLMTNEKTSFDTTTTTTTKVVAHFRSIVLCLLHRLSSNRKQIQRVAWVVLSSLFQEASDDGGEDGVDHITTSTSIHAGSSVYGQGMWLRRLRRVCSSLRNGGGGTMDTSTSASSTSRSDLWNEMAIPLFRAVQVETNLERLMVYVRDIAHVDIAGLGGNACGLWVWLFAFRPVSVVSLFHKHLTRHDAAQAQEDDGRGVLPESASPSPRPRARLMLISAAIEQVTHALSNSVVSSTNTNTSETKTALDASINLLLFCKRLSSKSTPSLSQFEENSLESSMLKLLQSVNRVLFDHECTVKSLRSGELSSEQWLALASVAACQNDVAHRVFSAIPTYLLLELIRRSDEGYGDPKTSHAGSSVLPQGSVSSFNILLHRVDELVSVGNVKDDGICETDVSDPLESVFLAECIGNTDVAQKRTLRVSLSRCIPKGSSQANTLHILESIVARLQWLSMYLSTGHLNLNVPFT